VIPSLGRIEYLKAALADLAKCEASCECLLILQDQPSPGDLTQLADAFPRPLRIFHLDCPNASLARNIGLIEARGEIVLFLDDDIRIPNPEFLNNHLRNFADPQVSGVYGQVLEVGQAPVTQPDPSMIETDWGWMLLPPNYAHRCRTRNGGSGNLSVRRAWAIAVGGMDAWFERGARREETEFNLRYTKAYGPLVFDPEAGLIHLSAGIGGSRKWGHVRRTVPMHHIVGLWYFFLAASRDRTLGLKGLQRELRSIAVALIKNPRTAANPLWVVWNVLRGLTGLGIALIRLLQGPKRLDRVDRNLYRELGMPA
jgi:glycosyltransferase involved in cell wall biosynthesis